jgi:hypothetical protein
MNKSVVLLNMIANTFGVKTIDEFIEDIKNGKTVEEIEKEQMDKMIKDFKKKYKKESK